MWLRSRARLTTSPRSSGLAREAPASRAGGARRSQAERRRTKQEGHAGHGARSCRAECSDSRAVFLAGRPAAERGAKAVLHGGPLLRGAAGAIPEERARHAAVAD